MGLTDPDAGKLVALVRPGRSAAPVQPEASRERYAPGQLIGAKYRLERVIGEGGMGAVWLARNLTLDVDVAIKLVRRDVTAAEASERLLREARAAARIEHPSIVRVFDFGETEHRDPFIVMEVVRGESLGDLIERKARLLPATVVQMLLPIADALSVAHARGIIHRDVKPDNIILMTGEKGTVSPKLVDFGIAKDAPRDWSLEPVAAVDPGRRVRPLTQAGTIVGSPDYMSPEQAAGSRDVDARTDIWSLCVVLYEAVCGLRPFRGEDLGELSLAILKSEPVPATEHGACDDELWQILRRGLDKDSQKRWPNMHALGRALAGWLARQGVTTDITGAALEAHWLGSDRVAVLSAPPPAPAPRRFGPRMWFVAPVLLLALGVAVLVWRATAPVHPLALESFAPPTLVEPAPPPQAERAEPAALAPSPQRSAPPPAPEVDAVAPARSAAPRAPSRRSMGPTAAPSDPGF